MSEIEVPLEKVQEDLHHHLHERLERHESQSTKSIMVAALLSAILAVFAAISALLAGHTSNEALIKQIESSDQWGYYQAKGIKSNLAELRAELNQMSSKDDDAVRTTKAQGFTAEVERYKNEQKEIQNEAQAREKESRRLLSVHENFATAVTFFQVAIALTAISVLIKRTQILYISGVLGLIGLGFMVISLLGLNSGH